LDPRLRSFAFVALLVVLPFSGIRVICVDPAAAGADPAASPETKAAEETLTDCERLCPFHPPGSMRALHADSQSSSDEDADCALSSDAAALQMLATIAVLRPTQPLVVPDVVSETPAAASAAYTEPALANLAPPPKAPIL
jgi:hypothetical protein